MKRVTKSLLSLVLAFMVAFSTLGASVFADEAQPTNVIYVGKVAFDADKVSNDATYRQGFQTYLAGHGNDAIVVSSNGVVFDANKYLNAPAGQDAVTFAAATVPTGATAVWDGKTPLTGDVAALKIVSAAPISTKSFKVVFSAPVADTTKVAFTVKRGPMTITTALTPTWNDAKTEVVLASSGKLIASDYTVAVKNDTSDLGMTAFKVEDDKVGTIKFLSDTIARIDDKTGKIAIKVTNQYGDDITNSLLSSNIQWLPAIGNVTVTPDYKNGLLKITYDQGAGSQLVNLVGKVLPITGMELTSGASVSVALNVSATIAGISEIKLTGIANRDKKTDIYVNDENVFYINYEAYDSFGNRIYDYDTLSKGSTIYSTLPGIEAKWDVDPTDSSKAVIKISKTSIDGTATIRVMSYTSSKTGEMQVTVKKRAELANMILSAPSTEVAAGETVSFNYAAYDQYGNTLTNYSDIGKSTNLAVSILGPTNVVPTLGTNMDGTFKLTATFNTPGRYTVMATVGIYGKMSQISFDVKGATSPRYMTLDESVLSPYMVTAKQTGVDQSGNPIISRATQRIDSGYYYGGLGIRDIYDRATSLYTSNKYQVKVTDNNGNTTYQPRYFAIIAKSDNDNAIVVDPAHNFSYHKKQIWIQSGTQTGSANITFKLVMSTDKVFNDSDTVLDTKTVTINNIDSKDIASYALDPIDPLYAIANDGETVDLPNNETDLTDIYSADTMVYGKTSSGSKVLLAAYMLDSVQTDSKYFATRKQSFASVYHGGTINVFATTLPSTITEKTGSLGVTVRDSQGKFFSLTAALKSKTDISAVSSVTFTGSTGGTGIRRSGDDYTVEYSTMTKPVVDGTSIIPMNTDGIWQTNWLYFRLWDNYGFGLNQPAKVVVTPGANNHGTMTIDQDGTGTIHSANVQIGDEYTITCIAKNGMQKTVRLTIVADYLNE